MAPRRFTGVCTALLNTEPVIRIAGSSTEVPRLIDETFVNFFVTQIFRRADHRNERRKGAEALQGRGSGNEHFPGCSG
jgi:hypothetical protein